MIRAVGVTKRFGRVAALEDVDLDLGRGETLLLLGTNGAGKSTLLRCMLGVLDYEGTIRIDGLDPLADGPEVRRRIGYMPQSGGLYPDLTVLETLRFVSRLRGKPLSRALDLLDEMRLGPSLGARVSDLSGGMVQRLLFVLALLPEPSVLLLDEPTASLDRDSRAQVMTKLAALESDGVTIILSTHSRRSPATFATRAITVQEGRVKAVPEALPDSELHPDPSFDGVGGS